MKKIILITLIAFTSHLSIAQNFSELGDFKFESKKSYKSNESTVLKCANYLFDTPMDEESMNRANSLAYIIKWMSGTPDYLFELSDKHLKLTKGSTDLFGLYMAAMTKVVLESKGIKLNEDQIYEQSKEVLILYCSKPENNCKPTKRIRKIIKKRKRTSSK